jgi:hypothetical protein
MSTVLVLAALISTSSPDVAPAEAVEAQAAPAEAVDAQAAPAETAPGWWVRDYIHYAEGQAYSSYAGRADWLANARAYRLPDEWSPSASETRVEEPTYRDAVDGSGFGFMLLILILVPVGSAIVFVRPRGVTWRSGSERITRAEARAMLGRL